MSEHLPAGSGTSPRTRFGETAPPSPGPVTPAPGRKAGSETHKPDHLEPEQYISWPSEQPGKKSHVPPRQQPA